MVVLTLRELTKQLQYALFERNSELACELTAQIKNRRAKLTNQEIQILVHLGLWKTEVFVVELLVERQMLSDSDLAFRAEWVTNLGRADLAKVYYEGILNSLPKSYQALPFEVFLKSVILQSSGYLRGVYFFFAGREFPDDEVVKLYFEVDLSERADLMAGVANRQNGSLESLVRRLKEIKTKEEASI